MKKQITSDHFQSRFSMLVAVLMLTLVGKVRSQAQCSMQFQSYVIAQTNQITLSFTPSSINKGSENLIEISFPDSANFNIDSITCKENALAFGPFSFLQPNGATCAISKQQPTDTNNNLISITNMQPTSISYNVVISLLRNPLAGMTVNNIVCKSYQGAKSLIEQATVPAMVFTPVIATTGLSIQSAPQVNGQTAQLQLTMITNYDIPSYGGCAMILPNPNSMFATFGVPLNQMLPNGINGVTIVVTFTLNSVNYQLGNIQAVFKTTSIQVPVLELYFQNTVVLPRTGSLLVTLSPIINPPCTAPLSGFNLSTGQAYINPATQQKQLYLIESVSSPFAILTNTQAADLNPGDCSVEVSPAANVSEPNVNYVFSIKTFNDIPTSGYIVLSIPSSIGVPNAQALKLNCVTGCSNTGATLAWDGVSKLTIQNCFLSQYLPGGSRILFEIKGFTNPPTSAPQLIDFATYANLNSGNFIIDQLLQSLSIKAVQGFCTVNQIKPTDDNRIYAIPGNYTITMNSVTPLGLSDGVRIVFPKDFYVIPNTRCTIGLQSSRYICQSYNTTNAIEIYQFTKNIMQSGVDFTFTVDSIINPSTKGALTGGPFKVSTITYDNKTIDQCTYDFPKNYFQNSNITQFTVTPIDTGVGNFPSKYRFEVMPWGDVYPGSSLLITMPPEISIYSQFAFERNCGGNLTAFTAFPPLISCKVSNNQIWVNQGFPVNPTVNTTLTQAGQVLQAPLLKFDLIGFVNPRSFQPSSPWNVTIIDEYQKPYYYWQFPYGPNVTMSGAAQPRKFSFDRNSRVNGAFTDFNFTVITMNYLQDGDRLKIQLPYPTFGSLDSKCYANSGNLLDFLPCSVSNDLSSIQITLKLPFGFRDLSQFEELDDENDEIEGRDLQASTKRILSGESFSFRISNIKNPFSFAPTQEAIKYSVFTGSGFQIEETRFQYALQINNTVPGALDPQINNIIPSDFRQNVLSNYTVTLSPLNYQQNMIITITLPSQVNFGNSTTKCIGLAGVDYPVLNCTINKNLKQIKISDAVTFQRGNPGTIKIKFSSLLNPVENIVTDSFVYQTMTSDGFQLDKISSNVTANFYCEYPCQSCNQDEKAHCNSCYPTGDFNLFFNAQCMNMCPDGWVNTTSLNCTQCLEPCQTCTGLPTNCTSCVDGYWKTGKSNVCRLKVYWPFPFFLLGLFLFMLIAISECVTKQESRFKEAFIALISIPEIISWVVYIIFLFMTIGYKEVTYTNSIARGHFQVPTMLAVLAMGTYILINFSHALIHPRQMVPNTLQSYKTLIAEHKCSTVFHWTITYLISFKYSLILVSYMWNQPYYRGDYSAANWIQFNRISFSFLFISYPLMMGSCAYYLATVGFWSYTGFVACEVILLSTILAVLMLLDALSSIKCKTIGKAKSNRAAKVASGADYESDEQEHPSRRAMKNLKKEVRRRGLSGADSDGESQDSQVSFGHKYKKQNNADRVYMGTLSDISRRDGSIAQTAYLDEETRKQIAMLEELAQQMREEKEQIRQEKLRIERERNRMQKEREQQEYYLEQYMQDYSKQTQNLSHQVKDLESQKRSLVSQVEQRLAESRQANNLLITKLNQVTKTPKPTKKSFRNFESEMEDYEPVEEQKDEDELEESKELESDPEVADAAQLPQRPAFGEIDYYRHIEGEDQQWMQQLTPRQGGDSMLGQHDVEDDGLDYMAHPQAEYDIVSGPPTREGKEQVQFMQTQVQFSQMDSNMQISEHDSEMFHARSDAAMEINSADDSRHDTQQDFFYPESPIYSVLEDRMVREISHEYMEPLKAQFGKIADTDSLHGEEQQYFVNEHAMAGDETNVQERNGLEHEFFKKEDALYQDLVDDGKRSRQATPQNYMKPKTPIHEVVGDGSSAYGQEQRFFNQERPVYSQNGIEEKKERLQQQEFFRRKSPVVNATASNNAISRLGDPEEFMDRKSAFNEKDLSEREMRQNSHTYLQQELPFYDKDDGQISKEATGQNFFKQDEPVRGEVQSRDKVVNAEPEKFFNNMESAEFGQPENFSRAKSGRMQEYIDRKPMSGLERPGVQGKMSPLTTKEAEPLDYFDKSEAEYGRNSTKQQKTDSQKYFDAEKAFAGRGDEYRRNNEIENEFNPPASEDITGKSVSGESEVANHAPFNALTDFVQQNTLSAKDNKALPQFTPKPAYKEEVFKPMPQYKEEKSAGRKKKTIIYSDKSESSVDELMADTPSNYNVPNGRLDGKSMGLKAIAMQVKRIGQSTQMPMISEHIEQQPIASKAGQMFQRGSNFDQNMHQQQRQFVNNLTGMGVSADNGWTGTQQINTRTHFIAEESSAQEHTSGPASQARRIRPPASNKNFLESALPQQQQTAQQQLQAQRQLQFMKNNFI